MSPIFVQYLCNIWHWSWFRCGRRPAHRCAFLSLWMIRPDPSEWSGWIRPDPTDWSGRILLYIKHYFFSFKCHQHMPGRSYAWTWSLFTAAQTWKVGRGLQMAIILLIFLFLFLFLLLPLTRSMMTFVSFFQFQQFQQFHPIQPIQKLQKLQKIGTQAMVLFSVSPSY